MGLKVGNVMKMYYNTGTDDSPTWTEIKKVGDVTVDLGVNDAEVDLRISDWILNLPAKNTGSFSLSLANDIGGTVFDALRGFAFARTIKQFASADADIATSGTEYFKAFGYFSAFPWAQPTQEMSSHDTTISLAYEEDASNELVEPSWNTVT